MHGRASKDLNWCGNLAPIIRLSLHNRGIVMIAVNRPSRTLSHLHQFWGAASAPNRRDGDFIASRLGGCATRPVFSFACPQEDGDSYPEANCSHHQISKERLPNEKHKEKEYVDEKNVQTNQSLFRLRRPY